MAVAIRMKRMGRKHREYYRICATDRRSPRDGRVIEQLGWFDPTAPEGKQHAIKVDRVRYWLSVGAQPSQTVTDLLRRLGCDAKPGTPVASA